MTLIRSESNSPSTTPTEQRPGVVERFTLILDAIAAGPDRMYLEEITEITGLPRSTVFRLLAQLIDQGWIEHHSRGYQPGPRMFTMNRTKDYSRLRGAASGILNELHANTQGVVHLTVLEGSSIYFLDRIGGAASAAIPSQVATHLPAESTISGRVLLAGLEPERVDSLMKSGPRGYPRTDLDDLHTRLNRIRQRHGLDVIPRRACHMAISSVAAPITGPYGVEGAISVSCVGTVELSNIAPMVFSATRRISRALHPDTHRQSKSTRQSPHAKVRAAL
ncbi:IclR family transcriptional regulator [Rhodococcus artemisiae]|uniref:IclR family transcriptional regulator n=1 Tax=Rhodococcus artemisiae TaxID=714159 RepID=A0ABU7LA91_9NOCA|nr:IclR family transcriptional regulator [Rhodococcus artemisiae]MEE2058461.1 IclR family transcriptional regulator [Rhodococcus artemisiae]